MRWVLRLGVVVCLVGLTWSATAQSLSPMANGLIVRFKDRPPTASGAVSNADTADAGALRAHRALKSAGIGAARVRAVGRASQHLDFGRRLTGAEAEHLAERLRGQADVAWVVPNVRERRLQVVAPDDPYFAATSGFGGQWWLQSATDSAAAAGRRRGVAGLQTAWTTYGTGRAAVTPVAVLDTGVTSHPDLDAHVLTGFDFCCSSVGYDSDTRPGRDSNPSDTGDWVSEADKAAYPELYADCTVEPSSWHGTSIMGILAAVTDNAEGVAGVNWNGRVVPVRVAGKCGAEVVDIIDGMRWAAGLQVANSRGGFLAPNPNPVRIINISFGGTGDCTAYQDTIDELLALPKPVVVVAAAGNEHAGATRPAKCAGVVGVVALNRDGFKSTYSNFGAALQTSGIATAGGDPTDLGRWGALGDDGLFTLNNWGLQGPEQPGYSNVYGSSFAAPVVAGVMSLMLDINPALTAQQLIQGLRLSARPHVVSADAGFSACSSQSPGRCICTAATCGAGILDAPEALRFALDPGGYQAPNRAAAVIDSREVAAAVALGPDLAPNSVSADGAQPSTGGGGALGVGWLLALTLALLVLRTSSRRS